MFLILLFTALTSPDQRENHLTADISECQPKISQQISESKTAVWSDPITHVRAYASVENRPGKTSEEGCQVTYRLMIAQPNQEFQSVKFFQHQNEEGEMSGVTVLGSSPDHSKIAADFWWAEGDYDGIRPVIYDANSGVTRFRDLEDRLYKLMPTCDYFQEYLGVTNEGYAILHVPKSIYVNSGECGDRGFWLFDLKTGRIWSTTKNKIPTAVMEMRRNDK
jgi:hypothetical protein